MSRAKLLAVLLLVSLNAVPALAQQPGENTLPNPFAAGKPAVTESQPLSATSLDELVAGIALYPDATVEQALAAASDPQAIQAAAQLSGQQFATQANQFPASIQYLKQNQPEVLQVLNGQPAHTQQLAQAAQTQLSDVWAAVDRVREQASTTPATTETNASSTEASSTEQQPATTESTTNTYNTTTYGAAYGTAPGVAAGAYAAGVVTGNAFGRPNYGAAAAGAAYANNNNRNGSAAAGAAFANRNNPNAGAAAAVTERNSTARPAAGNDLQHSLTTGQPGSTARPTNSLLQSGSSRVNLQNGGSQLQNNSNLNRGTTPNSRSFNGGAGAGAGGNRGGAARGGRR